MRADPRFGKQSKAFWAHVRSISEAQGYTNRANKSIKTLDAVGIIETFNKLQLSWQHLVHPNGVLTPDGALLVDYFNYRAEVLNGTVQFNLMNAEQARAEYERLVGIYGLPTIDPVMNKQKGDMKQPAYLTCIVNLLLEKTVGAVGFNPDPRQLTTFTHGAQPQRTLSRRVDGALPGVVNPVAIWEIKEYYYTTTFGSRVADGVYETLLDGMELEELTQSTGRTVEHVLILDAHYTWWECGRSYLCRIIDMLNMGYVSEVLFGREVAQRMPLLAQQWQAVANARSAIEPQTRGDVEGEA